MIKDPNKFFVTVSPYFTVDNNEFGYPANMEIEAELLSFVGFTGDELDAMQFAATVEPEDDKPRFDHDAYASRVLKQIVLVYNLEQYNLIYDALADYADKHGLSDNSEVIAHLLEKNGHAVSIRVAQSD